MIFIIMISVIFLFILLWKWKTIASFFSSHETELQRMKKAEKDGASWVTTVMAHNKVFPLKAEVDIDDSRVEINSRQADTLGDQKNLLTNQQITIQSSKAFPNTPIKTIFAPLKKFPNGY